MPDGSPAPNPPALRSLLKAARAAEARGAPDAAAVHFRDILARYPGNGPARAGLAAIEAAPPALPRGRDAAEDAALAELAAASKAGRAERVAALAPPLLAAFPDAALLHAMAGVAWSHLGRGAAAIAHLRRAHGLRPDHAKTAYNLGLAYQRLDRRGEAIAAYAHATERDPEDGEAWNNMGAIFHAAGDMPSALAAFDRAVAARPDLVEAWNNRGHARQILGDITGAIEDYQAALARDPSHVLVYFNIAHAMKLIGQADAARRCLWEVLKLDPFEAKAARELAGMVAGEEAARLRPLVEAMLEPSRPPQTRLHAGYAAAYLDFGAGADAAGMAHLARAGGIAKALSGYRIEGDRAVFAELKAAFDPGPDPLDADPGAVVPIFVLGMPRSGTSLTEEILARHSDIAGAGELEYLRLAVTEAGAHRGPLSRASLERIRARYLGALSAHAAPRKRFVIDKMPINFRFVGHILTALPEARVVHLRRRAEAVCWSNYRIHFPAAGMAFSATQADVAAYYRLYSDLMAFWETRFPGAIVHVDYEALTEDPAAGARGLLSALDLPWEDRVLEVEKSARSVRTASALQVKRGIYKGSSEAWRRYERWLGEMLDVLGQQD